MYKSNLKNCFFIAFLFLNLFSCSKKSEDPAATLPTSCSTSGTEVLYTEIAAPTGLPASGYATSGPGPRRILLASSTDGIGFTRLNSVVLDQANTPNMIVENDGQIRIYYTGYNLDPSVSGSSTTNKDALAVAVSNDQGSSWKYYCLGMSGFGSHAPLGDPDVVKLADGSYHMYITNGNSAGNIVILSSTSTDGFNFVKTGTALDLSSTNYVDSLTTIISGQFVSYLINGSNAQMRKSTSATGTTFTAASSDTNFSITVSGTPQSYILSNWLDMGSGNFRVYGFSLPVGDIRSFTTSDGTTYTASPTVALGLPLNTTYEKSWIKDAAVQRLSNGTYLMAYVSEIP